MVGAAAAVCATYGGLKGTLGVVTDVVALDLKHAAMSNLSSLGVRDRRVGHPSGFRYSSTPGWQCLAGERLLKN
jgi:hypothetical protein